MRIPRKGQKGFTLIELLIVVAILGVLAAVVIPNVQRFIGAGKGEAAETELANIQTAVVAMMVDNVASELEPVGGNFNDMNAFPDSTTSLLDKGANATFVGDAVIAGDIASAADALPGYLLYGHTLVIDVDGDGVYDGTDGDEIKIVNYVATQYTTEFYMVDASGTVSQVP